MISEPKLLRELTPFVENPGLAELGPNARPATKPASSLAAEIDRILDKSKLPQRRRELVRGCLLLWHDHLESAHVIAQAIEDADGSLLHAIMHRREPDYGNSKYWFRRVGPHSCYPAVGRKVTAFLAEQHQSLARKISPRGQWEPFAFVDACEAAARSGAPEAEDKILREIQRIEMESFLEYLCS